MNNFNFRNLQSIIDNEAKDYAIYTAEERAIPSMIDGFKPSQRFVIASALISSKEGKDKFSKLASVASRVSDLGYNHGEVSAQDAGALMANTWYNNTPLLQGRGSFGNRLVQKAAAARYVYCKLHDNFWNLYKDFDICPVNPDIDIKTPLNYLPIVPTVLLNGVIGIATGYSTKILPHSLESITKATEQAIKGIEVNEPNVLYPMFNGSIENYEQGVILTGLFEWVTAKRIKITEVPYKYDREDYVKVLDDLEESGDIVRYDDNCGDNKFEFTVTLRHLSKDTKNVNEKIIKDFKLQEKIAQNLTVINSKGKLQTYEKASELIKDFVKYRLPFIKQRIDLKIKEISDDAEVAKAKLCFITAVLKGDIIVGMGLTKADLIKAIDEYEFRKHANILVNMNIYHLTKDELDKLIIRYKELKKELEYWENTNEQKEYLKDLKSIK